MVFKVVHKDDNNALYAVCTTQQNAEKWILNMNPSHYINEIKRDDLIIRESEY